MTPKQALDWMAKLALERVTAHKDQPATQEAVLTMLQQANTVLRDAIAPKDAASDSDSA